MDPTLNLIVWLWTQLQQAQQQIAQKDQVIASLRSAQEVPPEPSLDKSE